MDAHLFQQVYDALQVNGVRTFLQLFFIISEFFPWIKKHNMSVPSEIIKTFLWGGSKER